MYLLAFNAYVKEMHGSRRKIPSKKSRPYIHISRLRVKRNQVTSKQIGIEVNADKTKYMVMSRYQHAGRSHSMKTDNSYFERVEIF